MRNSGAESSAAEAFVVTDNYGNSLYARHLPKMLMVIPVWSRVRPKEYSEGIMDGTRSSVTGFVLAICVMFFAILPRAHADDMTFDLVRSDYRSVGLDLFQFVYAQGEITPGSADRLEARLKEWKVIPGGWVYLNSLGGSPVEAMKLGEVIRAAKLETEIGGRPIGEGKKTDPGVCASACALAYLGGEFRYINDDAVYAVHRFFASPGSQLDSDTAQLLSGLEVSYIARMGADPELFRLMTLKGKDEITIVPHDLLRRYHVVTGPIKSTIWTVQTSNGVIYLRAVQEEQRGTNKLTFYCDPKQGLMAMGFLDTGYAEQIVNEAKHRGWMINGEFHDIDPGVPIIGPVANKHSMELATQVSAVLLQRLLSANEFGLAIQGANRDLFSGFQIKMDDAGRKSITEFVKTCPR